MAKVIAHIHLAKGETGYYDEKSGIFLNWSHPEADVTEDMDCSGLRVSQRCRRINVTSGSLGKAKSFKHILAESKAKRLGVPVEHILHKGKKRPVYVEAEETLKKKVAKPEPEKTPVAEKPEKDVQAKEKPAKEEQVVKEEPSIEEPEEAAISEDEAKEEKPKKTTRRRRTTKKSANKPAESK